MALSNFERMLQLADEVFAVKSDAGQLNVDEKVITQLQHIHPSTLSEFDDGSGPAAWILMIPATLEVMNKFLAKEITESELLNLTPPDIKYESIYLCSALVLPEYRNKGLAKKLSVEAIKNISRLHTIKALFVWPFSKEGDALANKISGLTSLPLYKRLN